MSGVIIEGLRPHCRILQTDAGRFVLTGTGIDALGEGTTVTVLGRQRPDLVSPCGGRIFAVDRVG